MAHDFCHTTTVLIACTLCLFIKAAWQDINLEALLNCLLKNNKTAPSTPHNMDANGMGVLPSSSELDFSVKEPL